MADSSEKYATFCGNTVVKTIACFSCRVFQCPWLCPKIRIKSIEETQKSEKQGAGLRYMLSIHIPIFLNLKVLIMPP
jgi:hypothetical protein